MLKKRGAREEKNVGTQRVEISSEVNSVKGKQYTLFENKGGLCTLGFEILVIVGVQCNFDTVELGLSFSVGVSSRPRWRF